MTRFEIGRLIYPVGSMDNPPSSIRDLAGRLLAASQSASDPQVHEAVLVSDKLRISLSRVAGVGIGVRREPSTTVPLADRELGHPWHDIPSLLPCGLIPNRYYGQHRRRSEARFSLGDLVFRPNFGVQ